MKKLELLWLYAILLLILLCCNGYSNDDQWTWTESAGWAQEDGSARGTAQEQFQVALNHETKGEFYDAARQYFLLVRTYPDTEEGKRSIVNLSNCLYQMENFYHSFKAIESCIERYPKSIHLQQLLAMEMRIGKRFVDGAPVRLYGKNSREDSLEAAVEIFNAVYTHDNSGPYADAALLECGRVLLEQNKPKAAKDKFAILIATFRESDLIPLARYLNERANIMLGSGSVEQAKQLLEVLKTSPGPGTETDTTRKNADSISREEEDLQEKDAQRMLESGEFYARPGKPKTYDAALFTFKDLIRRYPNTNAARLAQLKIAEMENKGRPAKAFMDDQFNLPKLPSPAKKLLKPKELWVRKSTVTSSGGPADQRTSHADLTSLQGTELFPIEKDERYQAGDIVVDLKGEEAELDVLLSTVPATTDPAGATKVNAEDTVSSAKATVRNEISTPEPVNRDKRPPVPSMDPFEGKKKSNEDILPQPMIPLSSIAAKSNPGASRVTETKDRTVVNNAGEDLTILVPSQDIDVEFEETAQPFASSTPQPEGKDAATEKPKEQSPSPVQKNSTTEGWSFDDDFEK